MCKLPQELTINTGRFYDFEQVLSCYLTDSDEMAATYFIVDPSRGMVYQISVPSDLAEDRVSSTIKRKFMNDEYTTAITDCGIKLQQFGWSSAKHRIQK